MKEVYLTDHNGNRIVDGDGRFIAVVLFEDTEEDILRDIRDILLDIKEMLL